MSPVPKEHNYSLHEALDGNSLPPNITVPVLFGVMNAGSEVLIFHESQMNSMQKYALTEYAGRASLTPKFEQLTADEFASMKADFQSESDDENEEFEQSDAEKFFDDLFEQAIQEGASDIHLYAYKEDPHIQFRINGELERVSFIAPLKYNKVYRVCRSIYGSMTGNTGSNQNSFRPELTQKATVEEKRSKTNGHRYRMRYQDAALDGEGEVCHVALRILDLDRDFSLENLTDLGYEQDQEDVVYEKMLKGQAGLIIIVGATGDGKTTTAATILSQYATEHNGRKMILTAEDPVEFKIPGVHHVQVSPIDKETESEAWERHLAAKMRMDPDFIFQGETRTETTAESACHAALTGHITMVTLHGNSAFDAFNRLEELQVKKSLMGAEGFIKGIIFQRLIPTLCPHCSYKLSDYQGIKIQELIQKKVLSERLLNRLMSNYGAHLENVRFRNHEGCDHCRKGYTGREAVVETCVPDGGMLKDISKGDYTSAKADWRSKSNTSYVIDPDESFDDHYKQHVVGFTVFDHGIKKMLQGVFSPVDVEDKLDSLSKNAIEMDYQISGDEVKQITGRSENEVLN